MIPLVKALLICFLVFSWESCLATVSIPPQEKRIVFGSDYDYPPYEFIGEDGRPAGFHIDLIRAIGKEIGYEVEIYLGEWSKIRAELENPQGHINLADMIYTAERSKTFLFVEHHDVISYALVRHKDAPAIPSLEEMGDSILVVSLNSIAEDVGRSKGIPIATSISDYHALKMVIDGRFNYALVNQYIAHKSIKEESWKSLIVGKDAVFFERVSFVTKKDRPDLADAVEHGLKRLRENGEYSKIYVKWFESGESYASVFYYFRWGIGATLVLAIFISVWVIVLRKQVAYKTREIKKEIEERKAAQALVAKNNEELEKRNYELDKIVYSVSHNVRSPIASALGLVNLMQMEFTEQEKALFYASSIATSLHRLDYYVNKILAYAANKNLEVKKERIDFTQLLANAVKEVKFLEGASEVLFDFQVNENHSFYSDYERLDIVLECLLANSVEYYNRRAKSPFVYVEVELTNDMAKILVTDNGEGIEKEQFDRVFEMFYRGDERSKGVGLGLYIVQQIIEQLGGTIQLESEHRQGTKIHIQIPNLETTK